MKRIVVRKIWLWVLLAAVLSLNGCVNFNDLKITSFKVDKVLPQGFKSVLWSAYVGVDNPSVEFSLYDISGTIKRGSAPLGDFSAEPVTVKGRTEGTYSVKGSLSLNNSVSVVELFSMLSDFRIEDCTVDLSLKVKPRGGIARKVVMKDVPASSVYRMIKNRLI